MKEWQGRRGELVIMRRLALGRAGDLQQMPPRSGVRFRKSVRGLAIRGSLAILYLVELWGCDVACSVAWG